MKKLVSIVTICALVVTIGTFSIFAANYDLSDTYSGSVNYNVDNQTNNVILNYNISSQKLHVIDYDIEYTESGSPTYIFTPSSSSVQASTDNYIGGSINMNSPTSTGSQSGRLTIGTLHTTIPTWGFTASPSGTQSLSTHEAYLYQLDFITYVSLNNTCDIVVRPYGNQLMVSPSFNSIDSHYLGSTTEVLNTNGLVFKGYSNGDSLLFSFDNNHSYNSSLDGLQYGLIDQYETISATVKTSLFFFSNSQITTNIYINNCNFYGITGFVKPAVDFHPNQTIQSYNLNSTVNSIDSNIQSILDQYAANAQNAQTVTDGTETNEQTLSNIATNEDTWFSQNDQALTATGMDTFTYTPQVMSGLTVISDQFNKLWLAIGDWNFVYTFSMMIGLVVLILRHNPQHKKSSAGGKSNASSS